MQLIRIVSSLLLFIGFDPQALGKAGDLGMQKNLESPQNIRLTVNSNADNNQRDDRLTLREAIAVANGELPISDLTAAEASNISPPKKLGAVRIEFDLPTGQNTIELRQPLPPITSPGLTIDGLYLERGFIEPRETERPEDEGQATIDPVPPLIRGVRGDIASATLREQPLVTISPAFDSSSILRGLTIMADDVTIRGLSLYGFAPEKAIGSTPSAEILIAGYLPEAFIGEEPPDLETIYSPKNIRIEQNQLGEENAPQSTFGIWIFNGENILIQDNQISHHQGSGIISSVTAKTTQIKNNVIAENGSAGMPDGIRLEGNITGTVVTNNQISGNGGAGIFLFKPIGAVQIRENQIESNGWRVSHPAIYLMGRGHEVLDNQIRGQNGAGVVVSANPRSDRNRIEGNQFSNLQGLSIDLNADNGRNSTAPRPYYGDGPNPERNSSKRRLDTGNSGINAPKFLGSEFLIINGEVNIDGIADPDTVVELYRVLEMNNGYGPLSQPVIKVHTNEQGRFNIALTEMEPGAVISAIATHPDRGTSEPARNATITIRD